MFGGFCTLQIHLHATCYPCSSNAHGKDHGLVQICRACNSLTFSWICWLSLNINGCVQLIYLSFLGSGVVEYLPRKRYIADSVVTWKIKQQHSGTSKDQSFREVNDSSYRCYAPKTADESPPLPAMLIQRTSTHILDVNGSLSMISKCMFLACFWKYDWDFKCDIFGFYST